MLIIDRSDKFISTLCKIKNKGEKERVLKQIKKIIQNPEIGKPMKYNRKRTREVYIGSFRLSYAYSSEEEKLIFLHLYHKDGQ
jgi:mRNA-degrading endonuclease RelE of RelBE toxin-antitoxin system